MYCTWGECPTLVTALLAQQYKCPIKTYNNNTLHVPSTHIKWKQCQKKKI
jgi:hypothetical protein